jgi:putative hemolysin
VEDVKILQVLLEAPPLLPLIALLVFAAYFSAAETALFSLSRIQLRQLKQKAPKAFENARYFLDRPAGFVATVLLGNELSNLLISSLMASYFSQFNLSPFYLTVVNLITVMPLIMIFAEITPKVLGVKANVTFAQHFQGPLWLFYRLSFPIRFFLEGMVNLITRPFLRKIRMKSDPQIGEADVLSMLEEGKKKGAIHNIEHDIIENLFEIDDERVMDMMTPLTECFTVGPDELLSTVVTKLKIDFWPRIPVFDPIEKSIVGILYAKDLLKHLRSEDGVMRVKEVMKEPLVIEPFMKGEALFKRLRQMKRHIAVVVDNKDRPLGIVTMEDLLEQIFGDLWRASK